MATKSALVTGAAGFIGGFVCAELKSAGYRVAGLDAAEGMRGGLIERFSLRLPSPELRPILRHLMPDVIVHCAGQASVGASVVEPSPDFADGPVACFDLLDAVRCEARLAKVVFISSAAVYGNPALLPVSETTELAPLSPYGYHKWMCELIFEEFARLYNVRTTMLRVFSAYGPGLRKQVVFDVCRKLLSGGEHVFQGTGTESRDFVHVEDIARAVRLIAEHAPGHGERYNIGSGTETRIADLVAIISTLASADSVATFDGIVPVGNPLRWSADITRARALGYDPLVGLEAGLAQVVAQVRKEVRA